MQRKCGIMRAALLVLSLTVVTTNFDCFASAKTQKIFVNPLDGKVIKQTMNKMHICQLSSDSQYVSTDVARNVLLENATNVEIRGWKSKRLVMGLALTGLAVVTGYVMVTRPKLWMKYLPRVADYVVRNPKLSGVIFGGSVTVLGALSRFWGTRLFVNARKSSEQGLAMKLMRVAHKFCEVLEGPARLMEVGYGVAYGKALSKSISGARAKLEAWRPVCAKNVEVPAAVSTFLLLEDSKMCFEPTCSPLVFIKTSESKESDVNNEIVTMKEEEMMAGDYFKCQKLDDASGFYRLTAKQADFYKPGIEKHYKILCTDEDRKKIEDDADIKNIIVYVYSSAVCAKSFFNAVWTGKDNVENNVNVYYPMLLKEIFAVNKLGETSSSWLVKWPTLFQHKLLPKNEPKKKES